MFEDLFNDTNDIIQVNIAQTETWDTGKQEDIWRVTEPEEVWKTSNIGLI